MGTANCKTCAKATSVNARTCPHCGERDPSNRGLKRLAGCSAIFVGLFLFILVLAAFDNSADEPSEIDIAECRVDLNCWGEKNEFEARLVCLEAIERATQYEFEWLDGLGTPVFSKFAWFDENSGSLMYMGDAIKIQNSFGAFSNRIYGCVYNPSSNLVIDLVLNEGKF